MVKEYRNAEHFYSSYGEKRKCCEESCRRVSKYIIQWFSYNQNNSNPLNLVEIYSCQNPSHFYDFVKEVSDVFGYPNRVLSLKNGEEKSRFLNILNSVLEIENPTPQMLRPMILLGDPSKKQLDFLLQQTHHCK